MIDIGTIKMRPVGNVKTNTVLCNEHILEIIGEDVRVACQTKSYTIKKVEIINGYCCDHCKEMIKLF